MGRPRCPSASAHRSEATMHLISDQHSTSRQFNLREASFTAAALAAAILQSGCEHAPAADPAQPGPSSLPTQKESAPTATEKTAEHLDSVPQAPAPDTALEARITRILPQLVELRHEIHANPELAFEEHRTGQRILDKI